MFGAVCYYITLYYTYTMLISQINATTVSRVMVYEMVYVMIYVLLLIIHNI